MIKIKTEILRDALNKAVVVCSFKDMLPLTSVIEIKVENNTLSVLSTDSVTTLVTNTKLDNEVEDMRVVVDAKIISSLVNKITTEFIELSSNGKSLTITGNGVYELELRVDESGEIISFPTLEYDVNKATEELNYKELATKLSIVKDTIPDNFDEPELRYYYLKDNVIAAAPSKITAVKNNKELEDKELYLRPEYVEILAGLGYVKAKYYSNENELVIVNDNFVLVTKYSGDDKDNLTKYLSGAFVGIKQLLGSSLKYKAKVNRAAILGLLERLSLFVTEYDEFAVFIKFMPDKLVVTSSRNNGKEEFGLKDAEVDGLVEYTEKFNLTDLKKQLEVLVNEEIEIQFDQESGIVKFIDGEIHQIVGSIEDSEE